MYQILLATDGSPQAFKAVEETARIAAPLQAEVTLLFVYQPAYIGYAGYGRCTTCSPNSVEDLMETLDKSKEEAAHEIFSKTTEILEKTGVKVKSLIAKGHPVDVICKTAEEGHFNLVVLGSRGLSGIKRTVLGSVSNGVVQSIDINVMIVK